MRIKERSLLLLLLLKWYQCIKCWYFTPYRMMR